MDAMDGLCSLSKSWDEILTATVLLRIPPEGWMKRMDEEKKKDDVLSSGERRYKHKVQRCLQPTSEYLTFVWLVGW
jgi:hypothetical protein